MLARLPSTYHEFMSWNWDQIEPYYIELEEVELEKTNVDTWLSDWSKLGRLVSERYQRHYVSVTIDTTDQAAETAYTNFLDQIYPPSQVWEQKLKVKLLASNLEPAGFNIPLLNMKAEADLFREQNLPLLSEELKLGNEYDKITGVQAVEWEGQEITLAQLQRVYMEPDRGTRQRAWELAMERWLQDRRAINELWVEMLKLRCQLAANAGRTDYRAFRWQQLLRFDYTPQDCEQFQSAIEAVAVPAAEKLYARRRQNLGVETLRPWDLDVDIYGQPPLHPFTKVEDLESKSLAIFKRVDPHLADYFEIMRQEGLLDLDNRKGKAPGGYCTDFLVARRPFIFMNAVGIHDDVQTLLHEGGHAFHVFESAHLPYIQQLQVGIEFAEVASTAMELLSAPYLEAEQGGFYSPQEAARARIEHLEALVRFLPYMAVVDAFQHWAYIHPDQGIDPAACDAEWGRLWQRFMRGIDWSGYEAALVTGWHRKGHIHQVPFYYIEYGLAQLGAMQIWHNAMRDQTGAVAAYRRGLALGGTVCLPELFATAGARFAFDHDTLQEACDLALETIQQLESSLMDV